MSKEFTSTNPLVTVIVPVYNHEKYIEIALRSVFAQTYQPLEIIVIDDGSKDQTREVVRELKRGLNFQFIENEKNLGLTKSLNVALNHAKGKYIAILAGDDYWVADKSAKQVTFMEQNGDVAASSGRVINVDEQGQPLKAKQKLGSNQVGWRRFEDFLLLNSRFPAVVTLVRRDVLTQVGGYDERFFMEDLPLWLKLSSKGWKLAVLPDVLGYYRLHTNNSHKKRGPMFENHLRLLNEYRQHTLYLKAVRAAYSRQIRYGISIGWRNLVLSIIRGFALKQSYFKDLLMGFRFSFRYLINR